MCKRQVAGWTTGLYKIGSEGIVRGKNERSLKPITPLQMVEKLRMIVALPPFYPAA
jgi:hypothetical protein